MITIETLKQMKPNERFATSVGVYPEICDEIIKWVAVRGIYHDWAIYYMPVELLMNNTDPVETVARRGDKIFTEKVIRKLVPCDDEAFELYRS